MKFAHLADCHVGSWRDPRLRDVSRKYFIRAFDIIIEEGVDFVLIAGDLFNAAVPNIESLKLVVSQLRRLRDGKVPVYFIAGSHDFSPSGKSILDVLEQAGLGVNVAKRDASPDGKLSLRIFRDEKTGAGIVGMVGRRGGLEKSFFQALDSRHFADFDGFKIFMFHSAINELKPKELANMESFPLSLLPRGFDYYAGGHVHIVEQADVDGYRVVFPGPVFPNTFYELEVLKKGGFFIVEDGVAKFVELNDFPVRSFVVDCNGKAPSEVEDDLRKLVSGKSFDDAIITLRLKGELISGRPSDIDFNDVVSLFYDAGAFVVLKNSAALSAKGFHSLKVNADNVADVELEIIRQHSDQNDFGDDITKDVLKALSVEKLENERLSDYEKRVFSEVEAAVKDFMRK